MNELPEPESLKTALNAALTLPGLEREAAPLRRLHADYARGYAAKETPLRLALVGSTGAGKSSLLNALAGQKLSTEGVDRPTTSVATVYAPAGAQVDDLEALGARIVRYAAGAGALGSGQIYIDTPDVNSVEQRHRAVAQAMLERSDLALVVMHKSSVAEAVQGEFLRDFARRRSLILLLNFADTLSPSARETLKDQARRLVADAVQAPPEALPAFAISALRAQSGEDVSGEFGSFLFALRQMATQAAALKVRAQNAQGVLQEIGSRLGRGLEGSERLIAEVSGALQGGLGAASATLVQDFEKRLGFAHGHLAHEVRRQAASKLWGPAAWVLRMSSFATGGLGAATLVARRSVPGALAVAAASTALEAIRERTRAQAAQSKVVDLEDDGTLERAAREALAPARTLVQTRGETPQTLGLPELPELAEQLQAARATAWRFTEATAIGEAVARWWRWARFVVLPLVNLPLFAFLGHVAYRVVRAYVEGPLLPSDYFLNAAALFVLLAGAAGFITSLTLGRATRAVERAGRRQFELLLGELARTRQESVGAALEPAHRAARQALDLVGAGPPARVAG